LRRHVTRDLVRISVLVLGDLVVLLVLLLTLRVVRDQALVGAGIAGVLTRLVPLGALPGVQVLPAVVLGLTMLGNFGANDRRRDGARLVAGVSLGLLLPFWGYVWSNFTPFVIPGYFLVAGAAGTALIFERQIIDRLVRAVRPVNPVAAHALLVGSKEDCARARKHPALADTREFAIVGTLDPASVSKSGGVRQVARLAETIDRHKVDTLFLTGPLDDDLFAMMLEAARIGGFEVFALARSYGVGQVEPRLSWRRGAPLIALTRPSLLGQQLVVKRTLDLVLSLLGLVALLPLMVVIALAIRLTSPGPVLFTQTRVGRAGRYFRINKFRSMVADAEQRKDRLTEKSLYRSGHLFKLVDDPRVTWVGGFLRRTSLDELPQLWNVVKGDMSLVGPRPPLPSEVALYEEHHYRRFDMKPGITGPWQVNGRSTLIDFEEVIHLEACYIRDWSIWNDLAILLRTIPAVVSRRGAH
jgi:exopolysaccharide biosynthesis polyprenyl glycosylphosphotransferase